jgi:hypothetical protein
MSNPRSKKMEEQERDSLLLLLTVESELVAILGGGVEMWAQILELPKQKSNRIPSETERELCFLLGKKREGFLCARVYESRDTGFGEHLEGLDEALVAFHGRLVDGGGVGLVPRDPP